MEPLALVKTTKKHILTFVDTQNTRSTEKPPGSLLMIMRLWSEPSYYNDRLLLTNSLVYPWDEQIQGYNIFKYKRLGVYCTVMGSTALETFQLLAPSKLISRWNDKDAMELANGKQGTIVIKSIIKP